VLIGTKLINEFVNPQASQPNIEINKRYFIN